MLRFNMDVSCVILVAKSVTLSNSGTSGGGFSLESESQRM
jgi:hypothetical protein